MFEEDINDDDTDDDNDDDDDTDDDDEYDDDDTDDDDSDDDVGKDSLRGVDRFALSASKCFILFITFICAKWLLTYF